VKPIEWHEANRLFGQRDYAFRDSYLKLLKDSYNSPLELMEFRSASDQARAAINLWVADRTLQRIRDLIPDNGVNENTRLVLVNALYLKAPWEDVFEERNTRLMPFHFGDSVVRDVPTMFGGRNLGYSKGDGFTAVAIPYLGDDL
jgi:serpin B